MTRLALPFAVLLAGCAPGLPNGPSRPAAESHSGGCSGVTDAERLESDADPGGCPPPKGTLAWKKE